MNKSILALLLAASAPTFAGTLTCKLSDPKSGKEIESSINVADPNAVGYTEDEIGEISFNLAMPSCDRRGKCEAMVIFNSSRIEDEVGSLTVEFSNRKDQELVLTEPINGEGAKGRPYSYVFTCAFKK